MGTLGNSLRETLKKLAYNTSVEQLRKKGVKNVKVVGLDRIVGLIEEAVHRSLRNKLMGLERERIADDTTEEFLRLLKSNEDLERSRNEAVRLRERAEDEVDELRRKIESSQQELSARLTASELEFQARYQGENAAIIEKIHTVFRELAGQPEADVRERIVELVMDLVAEERRETMAAQQKARDSEVERLERRLGKLKSSLEESEHRLVHLASVKNVEDGISSIYRDVQGVAQDDPLVERKREIMADIFEANLALQRAKKDSQ